MLRSVAAVLAGYFLYAIAAVLLFQVSGVDPHTPQPPFFMAWSTLYGVVFAALGGFIAASIAPRHPLRHAATVAMIIGVLALASLIAQWNRGAVWTELAALLLMAPAAWLGGLGRRRPARD